MADAVQPPMHDDPMRPAPGQRSAADVGPHERHDLELVAAGASAGDLAGDDLARASALVAACPDCARLADDLRLLIGASAALPVPRRPRDFRLTADDARRTTARDWRPSALLRRIGPMSSIGAGLTAIGLVGLLLGSIPGGGSSFAGAAANPAPGGGAAALVAPATTEGAAPSSAADRSVGAGPAVVSQPGAVAQPGTGVVPGSSALPGSSAVAAQPPVSTPGSAAAKPNGEPPLAGASPVAGGSPLAGASLGLVAVGILVVGLGIVRRRRSRT